MELETSFEERKDIVVKKTKTFPTLYDTINTIFMAKKAISRVFYIAKTKESGVKDEKENNKIVINNIEYEIKNYFSGTSDFNCMIIFSSINFCTIAIESNNEKILEFLSNLNSAIKQGKSSHVSVNIISYTEDVSFLLNKIQNPISLIPKWHRAETNLNEGAGYGYKDKTPIEKVNNN